MNKRLLKFVKEKFNIPASALDLGMGKGEDVEGLKTIGWKVEGVDKEKGVDLNNPYVAIEPVDLVYSNFVIQFIENKEVFLKTCFNNLKEGGWLFIQTFDESDEIMKKKFKEEELRNLLSSYFKDIKIEKFKYFDDQDGHNHWHVILEATGRKKIIK